MCGVGGAQCCGQVCVGARVEYFSKARMCLNSEFALEGCIPSPGALFGKLVVAKSLFATGREIRLISSFAALPVLS